MIAKIVAGLMLTVALGTSGAAWTFAADAATANSCCVPGADCCYPGSPCCTAADCCDADAPCCPGDCCAAK